MDEDDLFDDEFAGDDDLLMDDDEPEWLAKPDIVNEEEEFLGFLAGIWIGGWI